MKVTKNSGVGGKWLPKDKLESGMLLKLTTEASEVEGQNGKQLVAKCRVKGMEEEMNVAINTPSKNALIDAFGDDTADWVGKHLTVNALPGVFAGKEGIALYLIPEGFKRTKDAGGYIVITREGEERTKSSQEVEEDIDIDSVPF